MKQEHMSNTLKILSRPQGNAEEYGRWACNPYKGCSHGCSYCYLRKGAWKKGLGGSTPILKKGVVSEDHAYHLAMAEIIANREQIRRDGGLFMTFTSDPCTIETRDLFFRIAGECIGHAATPDEDIVPIILLTKNADFMGRNILKVETDRDLLQVRAWTKSFGRLLPRVLENRVAFGFTLTGHDELEPNASPNDDRIDAIRWLHDHRYRTWASIEPVIDFESAYDVIAWALAAGCEHFKIGLMTNNTRLCRSMYDMAECMDFIQDVMVMTQGLATVYWKQSFRDFLRGTKTHRHFSDDEVNKILMGWSHSVDMKWSMFNFEQ